MPSLLVRLPLLPEARFFPHARFYKDLGDGYAKQ
jgi:hypothetical protein